MRYSVVLPRAEPSDADETKQALKSAAELWSRGDQREALRAVRRAAWGCSKSGNDMRALSLSKAAKSIQAQLEAASHDGEEVSEQPSTRRDTPRARESVKEPRPPAESDREPRPSRRPKPSRKPPARASSPNHRVPSKRPPAPETQPAAPRGQGVGAGPRSGPQPSPKLAGATLALSDAEVDLDLVVTVTPGGWKDTEAATLVGHRAARVAVAPVAGKKGTFLVRVLGAGEVAPSNTAIALLVALETGARKVSRTG